MLTLLAALLSVPQSPASVMTALVNDTRSHGVVGDNLLSLDEAIRLGNGTLVPGLLSPAEQAQITGAGTMVERIVVDAALTPTITCSAALTDITGMPGMPGMGMLTIAGQPAAGNRPVLAGNGQPRVLGVRSTMVQIGGLAINGGQVGVEVRTPTGGMLPTDMAMVTDCAFSAQTVAAVRLSATAADNTAAMLTRLDCSNAPAGVLIDDQSSSGSVMLEAEWLAFDSIGQGIDVVENGRLGMTMLNVYRSSLQNGAGLLRVRRGVGSTQQLMALLVHCDATCTGDVADVQGVAGALSMFHHHHCRLVAAPGHKALSVWPRTAEFDLHGSEMYYEGDVGIAGNLFTQRFWEQNNTYKNGTTTIDYDGAPPSLLWNRYDNCSIVVTGQSFTPVTMQQSELLGTNLLVQPGPSSLTLDGCYRSGGSSSGAISAAASAPARFLGSTTVGPPAPQVGAALLLTADLPFGIGAVWVVAPAFARPVTTQEPVRFYGDPGSAIVLPGMVVFQSSVSVPIPNHPGLVGMEFYAQAITVPLLSQPYAPPWQLPVGGRVLLRP